MALDSLKRSFDTMMSLASGRESFEEAIVTTDSPIQSFNSTGSCAMSIDSEDAPQDSDVGIDGPPPPPPNTQSDQYIDIITANPHINTTAQTPTTTTASTFASLPPTVRSLIWSHAAPTPRTRFLELHTYNTIDHIPRLRYIPPLPPLFSTNRESRNFSIAHEGGEIVGFTSETFTAIFSFHGRKIGGEEHGEGTEKEKDKKFCFNFSRDVIWLSARFTGAYDTTETLRLTTLSSILPPASLSRIQRLLISYSGLDSYALIGPLLRPFVHLETLYLCMNDARIKENVKKLLEKGVPADGVVAEKVKRMVEQAEAEETDDDEETEMAMDRLAVRAARRVLEVNLRLGG